jgi:hypothetical protein
MVDFETFSGIIAYLGEVKGWKLSDTSVRLLHNQVGDLVSDDDFAGKIANTILETDYAKPDAIVKEVKAFRRQQVASEARALPAGAPAGPTICPELAKFARLGQQLRDKNFYKHCPHGGCQSAAIGRPYCQCVADSFAEPLEAGWEAIAQAIVATPGGPVAAVMGQARPDPKERDVVWVDA